DRARRARRSRQGARHQRRDRPQDLRLLPCARGFVARMERVRGRARLHPGYRNPAAVIFMVRSGASRAASVSEPGPNSNGDAGAFAFDAGAGRVFFRSMDVVTRHVPARPLALANCLTYARIAAVPAVVACLYWQDILQGGLWLRWVALVIFIGARITDVLDGYYARKLGEQSTF